MAERKAVNKYIPPDFDPKIHKSVNGYQHSNPLRKRASKLKSEGILVIRFELPYDAFCTHCSKPIARSTRFNAKKSNIGYFHSSPILLFSMKCYNCKEKIEIKTGSYIDQNKFAHHS